MYGSVGAVAGWAIQRSIAIASRLQTANTRNQTETLPAVSSGAGRMTASPSSRRDVHDHAAPLARHRRDLHRTERGRCPGGG